MIFVVVFGIRVFVVMPMSVFVFVMLVVILVVTLAFMVFVMLVVAVLVAMVAVPAAEFRERNRVYSRRQLHNRIGTLRRVANQVVQPRLLQTQSHDEDYVSIGDGCNVACAGLEVVRVRLAWNE